MLFPRMRQTTVWQLTVSFHRKMEHSLSWQTWSLHLIRHKVHVRKTLNSLTWSVLRTVIVQPWNQSNMDMVSLFHKRRWKTKIIKVLKVSNFDTSQSTLICSFSPFLIWNICSFQHDRFYFSFNPVPIHYIYNTVLPVFYQVYWAVVL